ncbi:GAF and ANTAR domain-containing protein [Mycobacterium sp.]|uniref:GAF and ANTAR domain-containing protein n=1 Tax=Mycobacterium sp. TaxID=1785 RepID=UPI0026382EBB|nr:GAF and ANTAR domain-containing protein [Mycobacterium sp.]
MTEFEYQPGRPAPQPPDLTQAQSDADDDDLYASLTGLSRIVVDALTVDELLTQVAEFAAHAIPGVTGAGVTVARPSAPLRIESWAVTAEFVREIDALQYEVHHEGPCMSAMRTRRPCISGSLGDDIRWPHFGSAVARLGVNSSLSLPLVLREQVIGVINAYADGLDAFDEHAVALGAKFAGPAAVSIYNARLLMQARQRAEQLQRALGSRSVIDQAIGIIRGRSGGSAEEAFGRMVKISQNENVKLHVIAERIVDLSVRRAPARED